ncbi:hypothetical protein CSA17_04855 [bacterium DOLJORAL78_65_58]|nr:MAG: hypothetical protein CSB20_04410 [bacterium DOLZORAL124_64_63]PIE75939.1 MAG: hypothetical protein CSA17_04855 [bacterium DOLJORAL78_65_58]
MFVRNHHKKWVPPLILLLILLVGGCKDSREARALERVTDTASLQRLRAVPEGGSVLFSVHGTEALTEMPALGADFRRLGSSGHSWLVVGPLDQSDPRQLTPLAATPELDRLVIWGDGAVVAKLDSRLRRTMLMHLSRADDDGKMLRVVARFAPGDTPLGPGLRELGAQVGSQGAGVVTLDASVPVLLKILARDDLIELSSPVMQQPLRGDGKKREMNP